MTITNGLITRSEYTAYVGVASPADPIRSAQFDDAITVASRWVEKYCGRQFHDSGAIASARYYDPLGMVVPIDDCRSITTVQVDTGDNGLHETTTTDYQPLPAYGRDPLLGDVPYTELLALSGLTWRYDLDRRGSVKVTGLWGWSAVPDDVKRATAILTQDLLRDPESQFGGLAVAGDGIVLGARIPTRVTGLLAMYVRPGRTLGIA